MQTKYIWKMLRIFISKHLIRNVKPIFFLNPCFKEENDWAYNVWVIMVIKVQVFMFIKKYVCHFSYATILIQSLSVAHTHIAQPYLE